MITKLIRKSLGCRRGFATVNESIINSSTQKTQDQNTTTPINEANGIPESCVPLDIAIRVSRSLKTGYPSTPISLNILCKLSDASVRDLRGTVILPHRFMETKVCVLSKDEAKRKEAIENGASEVGAEDLIEKIKLDQIAIDRLIVTPDILPLLSPLARILGPRGIMPTVKKGTVTDDVKGALERQADAILFKCDLNGLISCVVGKQGMRDGDLVDNIAKFIEDLKELKKGKQTKFVNSIWLQIQDGPQIFTDKSLFKL